MSNLEKPPSHGIPERQELSIFSLTFDLRDTYRLARALNVSHVSGYEEANRDTLLRYVLDEPKNRYCPIDTKRVILQPERGDVLFDVSRLILRFPDVEDDASLQYPNDVFIESVSQSGQRERHLLNSNGLWLYRGQQDLERIHEPDGSNDLFQVREGGVNVSKRISLVSRVVSSYRPVLQSNTNIERP